LGNERVSNPLSALVDRKPIGVVEAKKEGVTRARHEKFQSILRQHGVVATLRREEGDDIAAVSGQLRLQAKQAEREVRLSM
jgi:adenine C2-methylase RlmN of 23S rRNA A2503 and tRNA A37